MIPFADVWQAAALWAAAVVMFSGAYGLLWQPQESAWTTITWGFLLAFVGFVCAIVGVEAL